MLQSEHSAFHAQPWRLFPNSSIKYTCGQGRFKGRAEGAAPVKIVAPLCPPMKFMIKHNLPLVRGGSLCQYRSVPPSCNYGHPTAPSPQKCKPQNRHCMWPFTVPLQQFLWQRHLNHIHSFIHVFLEISCVYVYAHKPLHHVQNPWRSKSFTSSLSEFQSTATQRYKIGLLLADTRA